MEKALKTYKNLDLSCTVRIASAHRTPEAVTTWIREVEKAGVEVIIAVAGMAAALPGVAASHTLLPVIGVPVDVGSMRGEDALHSIVQMPPGIPVAAVGINNVQNALLLSLHILALKYPEYKKRLVSFRKAEAAKVDVAQKRLLEEYPQYGLFVRPEKQESREKTAPEETRPQPVVKEKQGPVTTEDIERIRSTRGIKTAPRGKGAPGRLIWKLDAENPEYDIIEKAADFILDGGVIAIPTDTVYGLACDSTNEKAVKKLYDLKGRTEHKPIPVLIDGMKTLSRLVRRIPGDVCSMLEELWPGALTVVFPKPDTMLSAVSPGGSLGIRVPDSTVALSIISMVARPLAVTSANPSGLPPATSASKVEEYFGRDVGLIIDGGETSGEEVSTVISVVEEPYVVLREGLLTFEILGRYLENLRRL